MQNNDQSRIATEASAKAIAAATKAEKFSDQALEIKKEVSQSAVSIEQAKIAIIEAANKVTTAALNAAPVPSAPSTPSKTTIRYINDTLFASNFGSILVSLVNFSNEMKTKGNGEITYPSGQVLMFGLFFIIFRVKAYLDDNNSLIKKESQVKLNPKGEPNAREKISFIVSFVSWISYSVSGYFIFTNSDYSHLFFLSSLVIFSIWIIVSFIMDIKFKKRSGGTKVGDAEKEVDAEKGNHLIYFLANLFYIGILSILLCDFFINVCNFTWLTGYCGFFNKIPNMYCLIGLLLIVLIDFAFSKSLNHSYR